MKSQSFRFDNSIMWILILGIGLACVSMAQAAEPTGASPDRRPGCHPASPPLRHCRPTTANNYAVPVAPVVTKQAEPEEPYGILPEHVTIEQKIEKIRRDMKRSGLSPEMIEALTKDMEKDLREEAARPKPEPLMTGILPGDMVGSAFGAGGSQYLIENGWGDNVNGEEVMVYAGSMRRDPENDAVYYDPLTVHGFVIIVKGQMGQSGTTENQIYTPTAVGSLHIVSAKGTVLTLQSRQGNKFLLNVETELLRPLGKR